MHLFDTVEVRQAMYKGVPDFRLRLLGTEYPGVRLRLSIGVGEADEARAVERAAGDHGGARPAVRPAAP